MHKHVFTKQCLVSH